MPTKPLLKAQKALLADIQAEMSKSIVAKSAKKAMEKSRRRKPAEDFNQAAFRAVQETIRSSKRT